MTESCQLQPKKMTSPSEIFEASQDITEVCEELLRNAYLLPLTLDELEKSIDYINYLSTRVYNFSGKDNLGGMDTGFHKANFYFNVSDDSGDDFI